MKYIMSLASITPLDIEFSLSIKLIFTRVFEIFRLRLNETSVDPIRLSIPITKTEDRNAVIVFLKNEEIITPIADNAKITNIDPKYPAKVSPQSSLPT